MTGGVSKKMHIRFGLAYTKRPYPGWRPTLGLLKEPQQVPIQIKGYPQFHEEWDLNNKGATNRMAFKSKRDVPKRKPEEYWNFENCHEMQGKFRFLLEGRFDRVEKLEKEIFDAANALGLVGWFKARRRHAQGHLQGDVFGLSQMKRWLLEEHMCPNEVGVVYRTSLSDENYAIAEPLEYKRLISVKDWRTLDKKVKHRGALEESQRLRRLEAESRETWRRRSELEFDLAQNGWVSHSGDGS